MVRSCHQSVGYRYRVAAGRRPCKSLERRSVPSSVDLSTLCCGIIGSTTRHRTLAAALLTMLLLGACEEGPRGTVRDDTQPPPTRDAQQHAVIVRQPETPTIATDLLDYHGNPVGVSCSTCHSVLDTNRETRSSEQLEDFHQGLTFHHGGLSCVSCHNAESDYEDLRLADGTGVDFANVMQSCAQCHGKQKRDYDRGLHGGMTGYWDLHQGPRVRHNCIDCHDPHAPAYPTVTPVLPPDQSGWSLRLNAAIEEQLHHD